MVLRSAGKVTDATYERRILLTAGGLPVVALCSESARAVRPLTLHDRELVGHVLGGMSAVLRRDALETDLRSHSASPYPVRGTPHVASYIASKPPRGEEFMKRPHARGRPAPSAP